MFAVNFASLVMWLLHRLLLGNANVTLIPGYCFNQGNCSFSIINAPNNSSICSTYCGTQQAQYYGCPNSNATSFIECLALDYSGNYEQSAQSQINKLAIRIDYCYQDQCNSNINSTVKLDWYQKPNIVPSRRSFFVYAELNHSILLQGENFQALYEPYIVLSFSQFNSNADQQLKCQTIINCTVQDNLGRTLNCNFPGFEEQCTTNGDAWEWFANAEYYSHNRRQSYGDKSFSVNLTPIFLALEWVTGKSYISVSKRGHVFPDASRARCWTVTDLDPSSSSPPVVDEIMAEDNLNRLTFTVRDRSLEGRTLNCVMWFDGHSLPMGTVVVGSISSWPTEILESLNEIFLILAVGFILMGAIAIGGLITFASTKRTDKSEQQDFLKQNLKNAFRMAPRMITKTRKTTIPSMKTGRFSV